MIQELLLGDDRQLKYFRPNTGAVDVRYVHPCRDGQLVFVHQIPVSELRVIALHQGTDENTCKIEDANCCILGEVYISRQTVGERGGFMGCR